MPAKEKKPARIRRVVTTGQAPPLALGAAFEQLIGAIPDTNFFVKDLSGRFILMDDGFVEMVGGRRREEVLGKTDFDFFPRDLAEKYVSDDHKVLTTGAVLRDLIEPVPDDDLTFSWWSVTKVPLLDIEGKIAGVAGITIKLSLHNTPSRYGDSLFGILQYIGANYRNHVSVAEIAAHAGLSMRSLERNFRRTFKTTPLRYINRVRLQAARHALVHTNRDIASIAADCGFYDQSHMTAQFSHHFGMSPRKYRTLHGRA
ncbi:MAG: AraC family transcriptional regulator [Opitutaceae bacterium]|nr:AraC family transcriptional regulator [Opitutaceae bacterium]